MGYKKSFQQKSEYKYCPKCGHLLAIVSKKGFKTGHNMNFCYNCGQDLRTGKDIIDIKASWDFMKVIDEKTEKEYILNSIDNILYCSFPKELNKYSIEYKIDAENFKILPWNFDITNY